MTETRSIAVSRSFPAPSLSPERGAVGAGSALCGTFVASRSLLVSTWQLRRPTLLLGLAGLAGLAAHLFASVANPFALVRFRRTHTSDSCSLLTNQLLVNADNGHARVAVESVGHTVRRGHSHRVREPD